nr:PREDICTED: uncharacterized protein LOC109040854 [Bemisia tabaci]
MDPSTKIWKTIVLADASLEFDKNELEAQKQRLLEELKQTNSQISDALATNAELKSSIESEDKVFQSLAGSVSLLKESKNSLSKEKNDLLKQLELQQIKNHEDKKQQDATISFYEAMWEKNLAQFHNIPSVKRKLQLETEVKKQEIELRMKKKELEETSNSTKQFVEINERRWQVQCIKLAQAWANKESEVKRNEQLHKKLNDLMKRADHPKEKREATSKAQKAVSTVQVLPYKKGTRDLSAPHSRFGRLQDISLDFSPSGIDMKLKEWQKKREADNYRHFSFSVNQSNLQESADNNTNEFVQSNTPHNSRNVASRIPVFDGAKFKGVSPSLINMRQERVSRLEIHTPKIAKPSEIMSPRNSRIPISNSPMNRVKELTSSDRTKNVSRSHASTALKKLPTTIQRQVVPSLHSATSDSSKRKFDSKSFKNKETPQKFPKKDIFPSSAKQQEWNIPQEVSTIPHNFHRSREQSNQEHQIISRCEEMDGTHENETEIDYSSSLHGSLNKTFTVGGATMVNREENTSLRSSTPVEPGRRDENFDEYRVDNSLPSGPMNEERIDGTVSKYFNRTSDKENTPPGGIIEKSPTPNRTFQSDDGEILPNENADDASILENQFDTSALDNNYSFQAVSPPMSPLQMDDDISGENFSKDLNKEGDSSDGERRNAQTRYIVDTFSFTSQPKKKPLNSLF